MAKRQDYTDEPAEGVISVPDNIQTAKDMLTNGVALNEVMRWLPEQCPNAFKTAEDVLSALGL